MDKEEICPCCKVYVEPIEPGDILKTNGKWEMQFMEDHDWHCPHCGWYWSDETVQQATKEYYTNKK